MEQTNLPALRINPDVMLPDNDQWENRFEVRSESSNRKYTIAQNKRKRHWGCSCMGYKRFRHCKHLAAIGVPAYEKPYEVNVIHN